jgi:hypothetical protein
LSRLRRIIEVSFITIAIVIVVAVLRVVVSFSPLLGMVGLGFFLVGRGRVGLFCELIIEPLEWPPFMALAPISSLTPLFFLPLLYPFLLPRLLSLHFLLSLELLLVLLFSCESPQDDLNRADLSLLGELVVGIGCLLDLVAHHVGHVWDGDDHGLSDLCCFLDSLAHRFDQDPVGVVA